MTSPTTTILIVDDEPQNRKLLEMLLQADGYATRSVANGKHALASIAQQAPDLILLDIMMPVLDGYTVARTLKAHAATSHIPIIRSLRRPIAQRASPVSTPAPRISCKSQSIGQSCTCAYAICYA